MSKRMSSRSGLFLLELIISILFFSVASAICIQLFAKAHLMDKDNQNLTYAVKLSENFAEIYTSLNGDTASLAEIYPTSEFSADSQSDLFSVSYDSDWNCCDAQAASYCMSVRFTEEPCAAGIMHTADISVTDLTAVNTSEADSTLYTLTVSVYVSNRGGAFYEE